MKVAVLLASGGDIVLDEFNTLFKSTEEAPFADVLTRMENNFKRGESEHFLAHQFTQRHQTETEEFAKWLTDLRLLVRPCNYRSQEDRMIRDQIITGVNSVETRRELLKESKLDLKKAIEICAAMEASKRQLGSFGTTSGANEKSTTPSSREDIGEEACAIRGQRPDRERGFGGKQTSSARNVRNVKCNSCALTHAAGANDCPAIGRKCNYRDKMNHFAKVCRKKREDNKSQSVAQLGTDEEEVQLIFTAELEGSKRPLVYAGCRIEPAVKPGEEVKFLIDSGATCNVLPAKLVPERKVDSASKPALRTYGGRKLHTLGICDLKVTNCRTGEAYEVSFVVVAEDRTPILGKSTAEKMGIIRFSYERVSNVQAGEEGVQEIKQEFRSVFDGELGNFEGLVKLQLKENSRPVTNVSCRISPRLKAELRRKLQEMEGKGVITRVESPTEWVNRLSIQLKKSGDLRLCLDPRPLNECLMREVYHTPGFDEIIPELSQARCFSKFDLADGFWHCVLDEESRALTTFQTPFGRFQFRRLPFGLKVAPEIFYKKLRQALEGLSGILVVADDVLVYGQGTTEDEARSDHDRNLRLFLSRCQTKGIKLNEKKIILRSTTTRFFGFVLSREGIRIDPEKQRQISEMKQPGDQVALKSFLGMLSHVARFVPRLSEELSPLRELAKQGNAWS